MNKFQQERVNVTNGKGFSEVRKQAVLQAVEQKKPPRWMPITVIVALACFALFFLLERPMIDKDTTASSYPFSEKGVTDYLMEATFSSSRDYVRYVYLKLDEQRQDAVVVSYNTDSSEFATVSYLKYANDTWYTLTARSFTLNEEHAQYAPWQQISLIGPIYIEEGQRMTDVNDRHFAAGMWRKGVSNVYVGQAEVETFEVAGKKAWIAEMATAGTPVFYDDNGYLMRTASFGLQDTEAINYVEATEQQYVQQFNGDEMHIFGQEFTEYPVVIDPDYYANYAYFYGDVVVVNIDGELKLTRILTATNYDVIVSEGTVIFDEVFVMPDNWASDGVKGIISKYDIVGKVIGYSKLDVPFQWTDDEVALYEQYKISYQDNLLKGHTPQTILRLQYLAQYKGDYRTMHALYSKASMKRSYEEWSKFVNFANDASAKAYLNYSAKVVNDFLTFNEVEQVLERTDWQGKRQMSIAMEQEDGIWKVTWESVTRVYSE